MVRPFRIVRQGWRADPIVNFLPGAIRSFPLETATRTRDHRRERSKHPRAQCLGVGKNPGRSHYSQISQRRHRDQSEDWDFHDGIWQCNPWLGLPAADAIHLACAAQAGTDLFLTSDKRLVGQIVPGVQFIAPLDTTLL